MIREPSFKMGILALKGRAGWWFFALCSCIRKSGARVHQPNPSSATAIQRQSSANAFGCTYVLPWVL